MLEQEYIIVGSTPVATGTAVRSNRSVIVNI